MISAPPGLRDAVADGDFPEGVDEQVLSRRTSVRRDPSSAELASQLSLNPKRYEPISQKREDLPEPGRAVPECPVEQVRKGLVRSLPSRSGTHGAETETAIGAPRDNGPYAVDPPERAQP